MNQSRTMSDSRRLFTLFVAVVFVALILLGLLLNWFAWEPRSFGARRWLRLSGYGALLLLLAAYAFWPRQWFLDRPWFRMKHWLAWHIVASFAALALTLVHSLGKAGSALTFVMMVLFWIVIGSGVLGYLGQKVCYRMLSLIVTKEFGPERLEAERERLVNELDDVTFEEQLGTGKSHEEFVSAAKTYLMSDWKSFGWLFNRGVYEPVPANLYEQAHALTDESRRSDFEELWSQVQSRRDLDIEYLSHRLARCWLVVHRVAAAALFFLVLAHVVSSIRIGGW